MKKLRTINSILLWRGKSYKLKYSDLDSFASLPYENCQQVYGVCLCGDKMVIVKGEDGGDGKGWGLVGGHIEKGESFGKPWKGRFRKKPTCGF